MYNDKLSKSIAEAVKKVMDEELKGQQHKLDVNKNNKVDAEDFKHLRAGKKPVAEAMSKADTPTYLRKKMGEKPLTMADVKAAPKDSISHPDNLAKARGAVKEESIEEFEMLDEEQLDELDSSTLKSYAKKANKQLKSLNKVVDSNRGKLPKPVNKAISQQQHKRDVGIERANSKISDKAMGITKEETEQIDELSKDTLKSYMGKAKTQLSIHARNVGNPGSSAKDQEVANASAAKRTAGATVAGRKLKEEQEQIQEYQSVGGKYVHIAKPAKDAEAGTTDWDKEEKMAKDLTSKYKTKKPRKLGARQNFVRSTRVNEGFSAMLNAYEEGGIKGLFESFIKEEPTNDEYKKELETAQAKSEGKIKTDVAKAAVQAVQSEEVEQLDELSPGTLKSYVNKAKPEVQAAKAERADARDSGDGKTANDAYQLAKKRTAGIKQAKAKLNAEEVEQVEERSLTEPEMKKKEEIVKSMKKGIQGFKDRYGADAKSVMYATATKQAKLKEETESEHYKSGHEYASDHAQDSGFKVTARARKKEMLADNPHKKGTPEHSDWHRGALDGHQIALDNM